MENIKAKAGEPKQKKSPTFLSEDRQTTQGPSRGPMKQVQSVNLN